MINTASSLGATLLIAAVRGNMAAGEAKYEPTWESLAAAPVPEWWDQGKFGISYHRERHPDRFTRETGLIDEEIKRMPEAASLQRLKQWFA